MKSTLLLPFFCFWIYFKCISYWYERKCIYIGSQMWDAKKSSLKYLQQTDKLKILWYLQCEGYVQWCIDCEKKRNNNFSWLQKCAVDPVAGGFCRGGVWGLSLITTGLELCCCDHTLLYFFWFVSGFSKSSHICVLYGVGVFPDVLVRLAGS
jgi:hypothetical protein